MKLVLLFKKGELDFNFLGNYLIVADLQQLLPLDTS